MKLITLSSIVGHNCGNPDCEYNVNNDHFKFSFVMEEKVLIGLMSIRAALMASEFVGNAEVDVPSSVKIIHYKLINTNVKPVAGALCSDLQWGEIEPPFPLSELAFTFNIDNNDVLSFSVNNTKRYMDSLHGYLGITRNIFHAISEGSLEYPTPTTRVTVSVDEGPQKVTKPSTSVVKHYH